MILMVQQFINRLSEMEALEREYARGKAGLVVVYGRRRVGKTELLLHFMEAKGGIYFLSDRRGYLENIHEFQRAVADALDNPLFGRAAFTSWLELFEELVKVMGDRRLLVIDEYPYLIEEGANDEFQKVWDTVLSKGRILLVLVGSSLSMMERNVLSQTAPLYGRRSMQLRLDRLRWEDLRGFFPAYSTEQLIEAYSVLDGIPLYLKQFSGTLGVLENIERNLLRKEAFLYEEAEFLLLEEFREPRRYFAILQAIASGKRRFGEIADVTSAEKSALSKYLSSLEELRIITDDLPFGAEGGRLRRYRLSDNYLHFWFRYVFPHKGLVEAGRAREVLDIVRETFHEHVSRAFETVVRDALLRRGPWRTVAPWWDRKGENEVDAIAVDERGGQVLFAEAKWTSRKVGWEAVEDLIRKSALAPVEARMEPNYLVASRAGFTTSCMDHMDSAGILHWGLDDLGGLATTHP
jgi:AAA+ ATPase superfamily predicted ATPase